MKPLVVRPVSRALLSKADIHEEGYFGTRPRHRFIAGFDLVEEADHSKVVVGHQAFDSVDMETLDNARMLAAAPELHQAAMTALSVLQGLDDEAARHAADALRNAILKAERGVFLFQREEDAVLLQGELGRPFR